MDEFGEWEGALQTIADSGGGTLVVGATDVGKTTFTRLLINRAIAAGRRVAILDADPGQSEVGPPACAGLAFPEVPLASLSELIPVAIAFVGSISPAGRLPEHITAVRRLADIAMDRLLVVDTSGYVHGPGARRLIGCVIELLGPANVVAIARGDELNEILSPLRRRSNLCIHLLPVPPAVGRKPPAYRLQRRAMRFAAYFHESQIAQYSIGEVAFTGTWFGCGNPVAPHILRFIGETLGPPYRVYYAETLNHHLGLIANRPIPANGPELGIVLGQLKAKAISITVAPRLKHLLVGLEAGNGKMLGLGLISSLDFRRGLVGVLTPVRTPEAARILHFGTHRITPDGADAGALKPDEL